MKIFVNAARFEIDQLFTQVGRRGHPCTLDTFLVLGLFFIFLFHINQFSLFFLLFFKIFRLFLIFKPSFFSNQYFFLLIFL